MIAGEREYLGHEVLAGVQFDGIALLELVPARDVMAEPGSEFRTRGNPPHPGVERGAVPGNAAWPEPVDEQSISIGRLWRFVDSFNANLQAWVFLV